MNLAKKFIEYAEKYPAKRAISELLPLTSAKRQWRYYANTELLEQAKKIAQNISFYGLQKGDRIAILSNSRPEWLIADLGILLMGGVSVAIYQTLNASEIAYILHDSEAKMIFAENQEQVDKIREILQSEIIIPAVEDRREQKANIRIQRIVTFEEVESEIDSLSFKELLSQDFEAFSLPEILEEDLASLVYTSGTTGPAKGVGQTHANHLANIGQVVNAGILKRDPSIMIILPLAHSFARLMAYLGIMTDSSLVFPAVSDRLTSKFNASLITRDIKDANANVIPIVPRIIEKMKDAVAARGIGNSFSAKLIDATLKSANKVYYNKAGFKDRILYTLTAFIRNKIKTGIFGNHFHFAVSGGAKLYPEINHFFESLGIKILQGYGLTETCVATNINRVENNCIGTVGPVLDKSIELKIEQDGEILFRGPNITKGYLNRPKATAESWDSQGWFHTGDLGAVDKQGNLSITGRKKELIVNSYGKKIAPNDIEARLVSDPLIAQALVVGNDKKYCAALFTLNIEIIRKIAPSINLDSNDWNKNPEILKYLSQHVTKINSELAGYEAIKKFSVLKENWTVESGFLTPTFKAKRAVIERAFASEINELYP